MLKTRLLLFNNKKRNAQTDYEKIHEEHKILLPRSTL